MLNVPGMSDGYGPSPDMGFLSFMYVYVALWGLPPGKLSNSGVAVGAKRPLLILVPAGSSIHNPSRGYSWSCAFAPNIQGIIFYDRGAPGLDQDESRGV